ncbi:hypothetical protein Tco_0461164 [Tanacetum coccineum]
MSSPNHPTSEIEDAFSSNFSDYIPASPDYVPTLLGKTYSSSSNNSFGLVPIASPFGSGYRERLVSRATVIENKVETLTITTFLFLSKKVLCATTSSGISDVFPSHPTSDIEDAFSSNFPDYISASPDYVPASPGKTYSSSSNNSFDSPIPPPSIVPPSSMISPMFNPQEFFLPEELLPLKKRGRDRSSSSTSNLPQAFKIGERSRRVNNIKIIDNRMPPKRTSTSEAPTMTQAAIRKLVADNVTAALEAQAANNANTDNNQ